MRGPAPKMGRCEHGFAYGGRLCPKCHPPCVFLPPDLAQDILAALEGIARWATELPATAQGTAVLAAKLRRRIFK